MGTKDEPSADPDVTIDPDPPPIVAPEWIMDGVVITPLNTLDIVAANRAAHLMFGMVPGGFRGRTLDEFVPTCEALDAQRNRIRRTMDGSELGRTWDVEIEHTDNTIYKVELTREGVTIHGLNYLAFVFHDPQEQNKTIARLTKANEKLSRARDDAIDHSKAKALTLARVAEVLRTPLSAIIGYGELLLEEADERDIPDLASDVKRILDSGNSLLATLRNVLDLSEIEAGRMSVVSQPHDLDDLIGRAAGASQQLSDANGNTIRITIQNDIGKAFADRERVEQILGNLINNAARFTKRGDIHVEAFRDRQSDKPQICITITDTGIGIAPDKLKDLFVEYGHSGSSHDATGAGVSLVVSHALAKLMGGRLKVVSDAGRGSKFTLEIPAVVAMMLPPMLPDTVDPAIKRQWSQPSVRVCVDNDDLRPRVLESLDRGGWPTNEVYASKLHNLGDDSLVVVDRVILRRIPKAVSALLVVQQAPSPDDLTKWDERTCGIVVLDTTATALVDDALHGAVTRAMMVSAMNRRVDEE